MNMFIRFLVFGFFFLCSCDKQELTDRAFVISIAIDRCNENPQEPIRLTLSIADVEAISERGEADEQEKLINATGADLAAAKRNAEKTICQNIFYGHAKLLIISHDVLQDEQMLRKSLETLQNNRQINHRILILVTEPGTKAAEILDYEKNKESLIGFFAQSYFRNNTHVSQMDLETLTDRRHTNRPFRIPVIRLDEGVRIV
jgi:hypothetical protein